MPDKPKRLLLLGGLYTTQYIGLGFIMTAVPAILRDGGASLAQISLIYTLGFVWTLKCMWSPIVDRFGSSRHGHYRSWLLVLQTAMIALLVLSSCFDPGRQLHVFIAIFALFSLASATQDIAADALGVNILTPAERGMGNSVQISGGFIGNLLGGGLVLVSYQWLGWSGSLLILAAATAFPLVSVWRFKEYDALRGSKEYQVSYSDLVWLFRRPHSLRWIAVVMTYTLGISSAYALVGPMLVDLGWSLDQIGFATSILGALIAILGALAAGVMVRYLGRKASMILTNVLVFIAILMLLPIALGSENGMIIYFAIELILFAFGASATILATVMMDKSRLEAAGTDYTLQYSMSSLMGFVFSSGALALAESLGYAGVIYLSLGVTLISILAVSLNKDFQAIEPKDAPVSLKPEMA